MMEPDQEVSGVKIEKDRGCKPYKIEGSERGITIPIGGQEILFEEQR